MRAWTQGGLVVAGAVVPVLAALAAPPAPPRAAPAATPGQAAFFESKVRPLLLARCGKCHGDRFQQAGLRLDTAEGFRKGSDRGSIFDPAHPLDSSFLRTVRHEGALKMPPDQKLSDAEISILTAWAKAGAPWPVPNAQRPTPNPRAHWAFQPVKRPALPAVKRKDWVRTPIDAFVLAKLEAKGLAPAPDADRRTLLRRVTFDLTGLPPTPEEIREFLADRSPNAWEKVVDRLLASHAYGERWGRHWLDVARYADSNGLDENLVFPNAWRYRDYVVRSFNADKPINRFFQEQIAGDLLPGAGEGQAFDPLIATGYLSLGPKMLAEDDPVKQEEDIIDEQVDTLGKTFMGLTLGCARCHDHKFDPFPQTDYYSLAGIFKSTRTMLKFRVVAEWQELPLLGKAERERLAAAEAAIAAKRAEQGRVRKSAGEKALAEARRRAADYLRVARELQQAGTLALQPALAASAPHEAPLPAGAIRVEAEDFVTGNVLKDRESYGRGIGVLVNAGQYPNVTEYAVTVPEAGLYQVDLRYASGDSRPVRLRVNGNLVRTNAAGGVTGGFFPEHQRWFPEAVVRLTGGKNTLRLERDSFFPHVDQLLLTPRSPGDYPLSPEQRALEAGLVPELLVQAEAQVKAGKTELAFTLPERPDGLFPADTRAMLEKLEGEVRALEQNRPAAPRAMAVSEGQPTTMRVHLRGDYQRLGDDCPRGFPAVLTRTRTPIPEKSSGRLELARWLTAPEHPLTGRVFVNRVWRWHFGRGLVPSTDNFGLLGDKPSHPELLDWLAATFVAPVESVEARKYGSKEEKAPSTLPHFHTSTPGLNWSLKRLHRLILLSRTYQMSSRYDAKSARVDPDNTFRWRWERRRLEAEAIRDSILAVSGGLDRMMGGSLLNFKDREYVTSTANADPVNYRSKRRSLYLPVIRSALYDVYTAFDFGDPSVMNGDRPTTTVAPQALFLMNSPLVLEQTRTLASRLLGQADLDDPGRVRLLYDLCFARPATEEEVRSGLAFVARLQEAYLPVEKDAEKARSSAWQSLCKALLSTNEFLYVD